jgi:hypothetical protein
MENKSAVILALGVFLGFGVVAASCGGQASRKMDAAGDASQAVAPDGPQGTGGATTSPSGGTTGGDQPGTGGSVVSGDTGSTGGVKGSGTGGMTGTGGMKETGGMTGTGGTSTVGTGGGTGTATGCCGVDRTCSSGYSCAGSVEQLLANQGACELTPPTGGCYNDVDCPQDGLCRSAVICACNSECFTASLPGTCEQVGEPCCHTAEDCTDGQQCVGTGVYIKGRCMAPPNSGQCYTSADCSTGRFCKGAKTCPCGTNCAVQPGSCAID